MPKTQQLKRSNRSAEVGFSQALRSKRLVLGGIAIIIFAVCVGYWPALKGEFILDDNIYLTSNHLIAASDGLYRFWLTTDAVDYYPLSNSTLWLEWRLWGMNPEGYHATNISLHITAALLIWLLLHRLSIPGDFLAALLFAVHPVNVESVAWISQRKGLLALVFLLLTMLCYLRSDESWNTAQAKKADGISGGRAWYWLGLLAFALAMLSKGSVAILPVFLLLMIALRRPLTKSDWLRAIPYWAIALLLTAVNVWCQSRLSTEPFRTAGTAERFAAAGSVVWFYLYQAVLPTHLLFIYPQWNVNVGNLLWWLPLLAAIATAALLWINRSKVWGRSLLFAWTFFCVALLPVMGFTDVGFMKYSLVADHYQSIAIIALVALVSALWAYWYSRTPKAVLWRATAVAVALALLLTLLTRQQSLLYGKATTLYATTLQENPSSWLLHFNLGNAFDEEHRSAEAIQQYQAAIELKPDFVEARYNLGNVLTNTRQTQAAIDQYQQVLRLNAQWAPQVHCALGVLLANSGNQEDALKEYQQAVALKPDSPEFRYNLGNTLLALGKVEESTEQYKQALKLMPDFADARSKLSGILANSGKLSDLAEQYKKLLKQNPNNAEAHYNLANNLLKMGRTPESIEHYRQAIRLKADFAEAFNGLGAALLTLHKCDSAISELQAALRAKPEYTEAWANLALAHAQLSHPDEAISAAKKALEIARAHGQSAVAQQIESWLTNYRKQQSNGEEANAILVPNH